MCFNQTGSIFNFTNKVVIIWQEHCGQDYGIEVNGIKSR